MDLARLFIQFFLDLTRELIVFLAKKRWLNGKRKKEVGCLPSLIISTQKSSIIGIELFVCFHWNR